MTTKEREAFEAMRAALSRSLDLLHEPERGWGEEGEPTAEANEALMCGLAALAKAEALEVTHEWQADRGTSA